MSGRDETPGHSPLPTPHSPLQPLVRVLSGPEEMVDRTRNTVRRTRSQKGSDKSVVGTVV